MPREWFFQIRIVPMQMVFQCLPSFAQMSKVLTKHIMLEDLLSHKCAQKKVTDFGYPRARLDVNIAEKVRKSVNFSHILWILITWFKKLVEQGPETYFQFDVLWIYMLWGIQNQ
jgi:hypothetical protein